MNVDDMMQKGIEAIRQSGLRDRVLNVGDKAPDFELPNIFGEKKMLKNLFSSEYLIIDFYRGAWCPYCNLELRGYENIREELRNIGADIVAISPEKTEYAKSNFEVLTDEDSKVIKKFGIVFELNEDAKKVNEYFELDLKEFNGSNKDELPVPCVYILDKNYNIIFRFIEEDYTERMNPKEVLDFLTNIKKKEDNRNE
jgi:peroxiredoxin